MEIRLRIHQVFYEQKPGDHLRKIIEVLLSALIILSIIAIVLESDNGIYQRYTDAFDYFEVLTIALFTLEYVLRIWSAPPTHTIEDLFSAIYDERKSFISALYLMSIAIIVSSCAMYYAEGVAQPDQFSSIPSTLWWTIITITTVGYGDVYPITTVGKVIGGSTAVFGIFTTALLTGIVANSFANQMARKRAVFEAELRKALSDGVLSEDEEHVLEQLRLTFNLTKEHAQAIKSRAVEEHKAKSN